MRPRGAAHGRVKLQLRSPGAWRCQARALYLCKPFQPVRSMVCLHSSAERLPAFRRETTPASRARWTTHKPQQKDSSQVVTTTTPVMIMHTMVEHKSSTIPGNTITCLSHHCGRGRRAPSTRIVAWPRTASNSPSPSASQSPIPLWSPGSRQTRGLQGRK